jgi:hypothetical protein
MRILAALALLVLCGCAAPIAPTEAPPTPAQTTAPTNDPSPSPTTATSAHEWPSDSAVALDQGTYTVSPPFSVPLTIDVPRTGWYSAHTTHDDFIDLMDPDRIGVSPTRWIAFARPAQLDGETGVVDAASMSAQEVAEVYAGRSGLATGLITSVSLAGQTGVQMDFGTDKSNVRLFGGPGGHFALDPSYDGRLIVLDAPDGQPLLILVFALKGHLQDVMAQAQPILDSVSFTGG